jgi:hypothetical protein
MLIHKYILLLFLCLLVIYYHIFSEIFIFNYLKIDNIEIIKPNNISTNGYSNTFIAILENGKNCYIGIKNEVKIEKFIKNLNEHDINYYTFILDKKNNICSKPDQITEIVFYYLLFYYSIIMGSIISIIILAYVYFECENLLNKYQGEINYNNHINV